MTEKVCLTTFVYGDLYQGYIPFLAYSFNKAYPEYDMQIFIYGKLNEGVKKQLKELNLNMNLIFHENSFNDFTKMNPLISKTLRWLLWDDSFLSYDYLYTVDIDILYIKEPIPLHKQHIRHMEMLGLPFSNIRRQLKYKSYKNPLMILQTIKHLGVLKAFNMALTSERIEYKMSGLHFVKVSDYYEKLSLLLIETELKQLQKGKIPILKYYPNNEIYLYELLEKAGFDLSNVATQSDGGIKMLDPTPNRLEFRPQHGIHLGMFHSEEIQKYNLDILNSSVYEFYIQEYKKEIITDDVFNQILEMAAQPIKEYFERLNNFYGIKK